MGKVLLWVIVILGVMLTTRILTRYHESSQRRSAEKAGRASAHISGNPEPMVRCAHCSIHIPRSEAVLSGGKTWCCTEHAKLGPGA